MRPDGDIEQDVKAELRWSPQCDATDVAVSVKDGVVMLAGFVPRYSDRYEAERAAKRIAGVVGVANDIEVCPPSADERPDPLLAREVIAAIAAQLPRASEQIKAIVRRGWLTLEGEVEWQYQRKMAEEAVRGLPGIKGISNLIQVKPERRPGEIGGAIRHALERNAQIDANRITAVANGDEVTIAGRACNWHELEEAERTAWCAPGVSKVDNRVVVSSDCNDNELGTLWIGNRTCDTDGTVSSQGH
jgi:osmotically-inducible protein OsmY